MCYWFNWITKSPSINNMLELQNSLLKLQNSLLNVVICVLLSYANSHCCTWFVKRKKRDVECTCHMFVYIVVFKTFQIL